MSACIYARLYSYVRGMRTIASNQKEGGWVSLLQVCQLPILTAFPGMPPHMLQSVAIAGSHDDARDCTQRPGWRSAHTHTHSLSTVARLYSDTHDPLTGRYSIPSPRRDPNFCRERGSCQTAVARWGKPARPPHQGAGANPDTFLFSRVGGVCNVAAVGRSK